MKKLILPMLALLLVSFTGFAQNSSVVRDYIARYREIAMEEMQRTGVPAAITLAQGILETEAGRSNLVQRSNNHFGIKCKSNWTGQTVYHDDDAKGECFRKYDDPVQSYRDHSDFLKTRAHYASLFKLDPADYEGWAYGLKKAGYATNPKYPQILIRIIREYNLQEYTLLAMNKTKPADATETWATAGTVQTGAEKSGPSAAITPAAYPETVFRINEVNVVYVPAGTSFLALAEKYNLSVSRLLEYNDLRSGTETQRDGLVYLQRKKKTGVSATRTVAAGETLYDIAQAEGIRMENLAAYNNLSENVNPGVGTVLSLNGATIPTVRQRENNSVYAAGQYIDHVVAPKETLYAIAKKYSVTVEEIRQWNNLPSNDLKKGQHLRINQR